MGKKSYSDESLIITENPVVNNFIKTVCKYDDFCSRPNCMYMHSNKQKKVAYGNKNKSVVFNDKFNRSFAVPDDETVKLESSDMNEMV